MAFYPPRMALIGLKLCQNTFQTIPDISFFDEVFSDFLQSLKVRLPPGDGSDRHETSLNPFQTIPKFSFFDVKKFFSKLRTAVYPPNMAPIGAKLWENAFQAICKFSFFDAEIFLDKKFVKGSIFFSRNWRFGGAMNF